MKDVFSWIHNIILSIVYPDLVEESSKDVILIVRQACYERDIY